MIWHLTVFLGVRIDLCVAAAAALDAGVAVRVPEDGDLDGVGVGGGAVHAVRQGGVVRVGTHEPENAV